MGLVYDCLYCIFDGGVSDWSEWVQVSSEAVAGASCAVWDVCGCDVGGFYAVPNVSVAPPLFYNERWEKGSEWIYANTAV